MTKMQQGGVCLCKWSITFALAFATQVNLHFPCIHHFSVYHFNHFNASMTFIFHFQKHLSKDKACVENQGTASTRLPGFYSRHHTYMSGCFLVHEEKGTNMNQERLFRGRCQEIVGGRRRQGRWKLRCASSVCQPDSNTAAGEERQLKTSSPINLANALLPKQASLSYITFCHISRLLQIFTCLFAQWADPHTLSKYQAGSNVLKLFLQLQIRRILLAQDPLKVFSSLL